MTEEFILALAHETAQSEWYVYAVRSPGDLAASLASFGCRIAEAAIKEATEPLSRKIDDLEEDAHILDAEFNELHAIARKLAEKCLRGKVCNACGSVGYMRVTHNEGCPVKRLEAFK